MKLSTNVKNSIKKSFMPFNLSSCEQLIREILNYIQFLNSLRGSEIVSYNSSSLDIFLSDYVLPESLGPIIYELSNLISLHYDISLSLGILLLSKHIITTASKLSSFLDLLSPSENIPSSVIGITPTAHYLVVFFSAC